MTFLNKLFRYFLFSGIIMALFVMIMMLIGIIMVTIGIQYFTYSDWIYCIFYITASCIAILVFKINLNIQTKLEDE